MCGRAGAPQPGQTSNAASSSVTGPALTEAMVRFAVRHEYARSVEDVLARRSRLLFLDARLAASVAGRVAAILDEELGGAFNAAESERSFIELAERYARLPA